jgi:hypothetical protein
VSIAQEEPGARRYGVQVDSRHAVEPDGLLTAYTLAARVCAGFDRPYYEHLSLAENVA